MCLTWCVVRFEACNFATARAAVRMFDFLKFKVCSAIPDLQLCERKDCSAEVANEPLGPDSSISLRVLLTKSLIWDLWSSWAPLVFQVFPSSTRRLHLRWRRQVFIIFGPHVFYRNSANMMNMRSQSHNLPTQNIMCLLSSRIRSALPS